VSENFPHLGISGPFRRRSLARWRCAQAPEAIAQVQLLVCELRRVTLLWDELWAGTLSQHHAEIARRITQLDAETQRVDNNPSLTPAEKDALVAEKYRIILKPVSAKHTLHNVIFN